MSANNCAAVVLSAGASTRLKQPKQLVHLNGETLLQRTARFALEAGCSPVIVVLGFEAERMQQTLSGLDVKFVLNPDWPTGMASSLRCGIEAIEEDQPVSREHFDEREAFPGRVLLLVSDQPHLSAAVLQSLLLKNSETQSLITASRYAERSGVPAIFRRPLLSELKSIEGDKGARQMIELHRNQATFVDFPEGAFDLDTPEDLKTLLEDENAFSHPRTPTQRVQGTASFVRK
jgi:molybdenum cofactor cytidylyltransferase